MAFRKIEEEGVLPGPRALLLSGFRESEISVIREYLRESGIDEVEIIPCRYDSLDQKVSLVLSGKSNDRIVESDKLPPVALWSGLTHRELDKALADFQNTGLQRPIFATTTVPNLDFTVKELLNHLLNEQKSMREAMGKKEK